VIVGFSTSSPWASVALFSPSGGLLWAGRREAPQSASAACMGLLAEAESAGFAADQCGIFLADLGPGSFTGVRVGVALAKTFAFALGGLAGGATAFDLISPEQSVVIPSKRGEFFVRTAGGPVERTARLPGGASGYGHPGEQNFPDATRFGPLLPTISHVEPEALMPMYLIEPSISTPKRPFAEADAP
jgi:hypothetical protein